jgi:hypothetical protein
MSKTKTIAKDTLLIVFDHHNTWKLQGGPVTKPKVLTGEEIVSMLAIV